MNQITIACAGNIITKPLNCWSLFDWFATIGGILLAAVVIYVAYSIRLQATATKWRKNIAVGDRACFRNIMNGWSCGTIDKIRDGKAYVKRESFTSKSAGWHNIANLYPHRKSHA